MLTWESSKIVGYDANGDPLERKSGYCVAADTKPTGGSIANGSRLIEMDTGKVFFFDAESGEWDEFGSGGGSGGGNPNTVQTITGTLDDPWGDLDYAEFRAALIANEATAKIAADATSLGFGTIEQPVQAGDNMSTFTDGCFIDGENITANDIRWDSTIGDLVTFAIFANGTVADAIQYASLVPTTLTIIWHPLP